MAGRIDGRTSEGRIAENNRIVRTAVRETAAGSNTWDTPVPCCHRKGDSSRQHSPEYLCTYAEVLAVSSPMRRVLNRPPARKTTARTAARGRLNAFVAARFNARKCMRHYN